MKLIHPLDFKIPSGQIIEEFSIWVIDPDLTDHERNLNLAGRIITDNKFSGDITIEDYQYTFVDGKQIKSKTLKVKNNGR